MLRVEEVRIDIGRCAGGTFLRVVHVSTGVSRTKAPLGGEDQDAVRSRLLAEVESEVMGRGTMEERQNEMTQAAES